MLHPNVIGDWQEYDEAFTGLRVRVHGLMKGNIPSARGRDDKAKGLTYFSVQITVENRAEEYFDLRLSNREAQVRAGKDGHSAFLDEYGSAWIENFRVYPLRRATATLYAAAPASHLKTLDIQIAMRVDDERTAPYVWVGSDGVPESTGRNTVKMARGKESIADEASKFLEEGKTDV
ncbi:hypothetical protein [Streptomyces atroolivaceus]|uniref:hypothetical protein n=1 Tax=Streptomyces atroolivaceus TaxID=66869 RepID=UPI002024876E|nr:hypothetical protein [Streptomyces atroolivaceus]